MMAVGIGAEAQENYSELIRMYREKIKAEHIEDDRSPLNENDFQHIYYFKANPKYKINGRLIPFAERDTVTIPTSSGKQKKFIRAGKIEFQLHSGKYQLTAYLGTKAAVPDHEYFIPFKDKTNGNRTYEGGRFLEIATDAVVNGIVEIDFNKAYNPWCAYSDGFNCPIPPVENELAISIKAGEKKYKGEKKHHKK